MAGASGYRLGNIPPYHLLVRHYPTLPDDDSVKEAEDSTSGYMQPVNSDTRKEQRTFAGPRNQDLAAMIDHTLLNPRLLTRNQNNQQAGAVMALLPYVSTPTPRRCAELLQVSARCPIDGFPLGATLPSRVRDAASERGATEIDMVIH
jgi:hypothetical protein